ncbi:hypothetical protein [Nostoc sp. ChiQUE01b]|nr:hypothetical protein [Nostoc sp. ChiQUE01b]
MLGYGQRMVRAKAGELEEQFGSVRSQNTRLFTFTHSKKYTNL